MRTRSPWSTLVCSAAVGCSLLLSSGVGAQTAAPATDDDVKQTFAKGQELFKKKDLVQACALFEDARSKRSEWVGVSVWLALCYESSGDLARAWDMYDRVERLARKTGGHAEEEAGAHASAEALAKRLPKLVLRVPEDVRALPDLTIRSDGRKISLEQWASPIPVSAAKHHLTVTASGRRDLEIDVDTTGSTSDFPIDIAPLEKTDAPPLTSSSALPGASATVAPSGTVTASTSTPIGGDKGPPSQSRESGRAIPTWTWIAGATGLALGATSIGFLVDQLGVQETIDDHCTATSCTSTPDFYVNHANAHLWRSYGLFVGLGGGSVLGLAIAVYGIATAPSSRGEKDAGKKAVRWAPVVSVTAGRADLGIAGQF